MWTPRKLLCRTKHHLNISWRSGSTMVQSQLGLLARTSSAMHQLQEYPLPYVCGAASVPRCSVDLAGTPRRCQVAVGCLGSPRVARGSTRWRHCYVLLHTSILSPVGSVDQKQILIALTVHLEKVFPLTLHFPNRFVCVFSKGAEIRQLVICSIF